MEFWLEHHRDKTNTSPDCRSQTWAAQAGAVPVVQMQVPGTQQILQKPGQGTSAAKITLSTPHPWDTQPEHPGEPGHHNSAHTSSPSQSGAAKSPIKAFAGQHRHRQQAKTRTSTTANVTHGKAGQISKRTGAPLLPGMIETVSFSQDTTLTYSCTEEGMRHLKTATFPRIDLWSSTRTVYGSLKTVEESRWLVA